MISRMLMMAASNQGIPPPCIEGSLALIQNYPTPVYYGVDKILVSHNGLYAYSAGAGHINTSVINISTGALTSLVSISGIPQQWRLIISSNDKFLYVYNRGAYNYPPTIRRFECSSVDGTLTQVGSDITIGGNAVTNTNMVFSPNSDFLYVTTYDSNYNSSTSKVLTYSHNNTTGNLVLIDTILVEYPTEVSVSPDGNYVYVNTTYPVQEAIRIYDRNSGTGLLTYNSMADYGSYSGGLGIISPDGKNIYLNPASDSFVRVLSRTVANQTSSIQTFSAANFIYDVIVSPDGLNVYFLTYDSSSTFSTPVEVYSRNTLTGTLTLAATTALPTSHFNYAMAMSPNGNNIYITDRYDNLYGAILTYKRECL